mmetsp:Transcript_8956/g.17456  ORF Transcript_8956/g.17456 Transcript_8956/m.17456 type:complete len:296 (+) Transcript_8956:503-1390(+)
MLDVGNDLIRQHGGHPRRPQRFPELQARFYRALAEAVELEGSLEFGVVLRVVVLDRIPHRRLLLLLLLPILPRAPPPPLGLPSFLEQVAVSDDLQAEGAGEREYLVKMADQPLRHVSTCRVESQQPHGGVVRRRRRGGRAHRDGRLATWQGYLGVRASEYQDPSEGIKGLQQQQVSGRVLAVAQQTHHHARTGLLLHLLVDPIELPQHGVHLRDRLIVVSGNLLPLLLILLLLLLGPRRRGGSAFVVVVVALAALLVQGALGDARGDVVENGVEGLRIHHPCLRSTRALEAQQLS